MQNKIRQAVILSAGLGTRLREITGEAIPKVMVPLLGKPLLEHNIEQFKKYGVTEFFINLHYLPEKIQSYFGDGKKWSVKISYFLEEPKILGTAGGIKDFEGILDESFFVIYGDILSLVNYSNMADAFFRKPEAICMEVVGDTDHPHDSDLVEADEGLKFLKIYPKPHTMLPKNYKSMRGIYIFNERISKHIPAGRYYEIDHDLLPEVITKRETIYGYETTDFLEDIGTPERYNKVAEYLEKIKNV